VLAEPSLDQLRGELQAGLASTAHGELSYVGRGAIDAPIVDGKLGARLSGFYTTDSGYIDNVSTGKDNVNESKNQGGRLALLWQPTDSFTATLSSLYQKRTNEGLGSETVNNTTLRPTVGEYKQDVATREFIETQYQLHSLKLEFDLGFGSLVSATAYGSQETSLAADVSDFFGVLLGVPAVTLPFEGDVKKFTQEFRLASKAGGRFDYIGGAGTPGARYAVAPFRLSAFSSVYKLDLQE
jgi:hypothetical protein